MSAGTRRQFLQAGAAMAAVLGLAPVPALASPAGPLLSFLSDSRHPSSRDLAERVRAAGGAVLAVDGGDVASAIDLIARAQAVAGRTTYADFLWLADLARARTGRHTRLRLTWHAYRTVSANGWVDRQVLIEEGRQAPRLQRLTSAGCDAWLPVLPPRPACGPSVPEEGAGCTLHDWLFLPV